MSANYVAQQLNFCMTQGWAQGDQATQAYFRPIETFGERFDALLEQIADLGFTAIDLWGGHLHYAWATPAHIEVARALLEKYGFTVTSLACWLGGSLDDLAKACDLAEALGTTILGGGGDLLVREYTPVVEMLRARGIRWAYENHPETTPAEVLAKIGDAHDVVGVAFDTGWFATHGYNAALAASELYDRIMLVHLKDIKAFGGHETCLYGKGVVPVAEVVHVLQSRGYSGDYSIEHEPERFDPSNDCVLCAEMLETWLR